MQGALTILKFGRYKGKDADDVPANYLKYLSGLDISDPELEEYLEKNMEAVNRQIELGMGDV